jgi:hypothetical protein
MTFDNPVCILIKYTQKFTRTSLQVVNITGPKSSPAAKDMLKNKMTQGRICMNK